MNIFSDSPLGIAFNKAAKGLVFGGIATGIVAFFSPASALTFAAVYSLMTAAEAWTTYNYEAGKEIPEYIKKGEPAPVLKK